MKNLDKLFPIMLYAEDMGSWARSHELAKSIWFKTGTKDDPAYYALDCDILSLDKVVIKVRTMTCNVYGGIGNVILTREVTSFTEEENVLIRNEITKKAYRHAHHEYKLRQEEEIKRKVKALATEMFGVE